jgi:hypothetical protein
MPNETQKENYYEKPKVASASPVKGGMSKPKPALKDPPKMSAKKVSSGEPKNIRDLEDKMKFREVGVLSRKMSPYKLVGRNWNSSSTFYYSKGKVFRGDRLDPKKVTPGTRVFLRK